MTESTAQGLEYRSQRAPRPPLPSFYRTDAFRRVALCWAVTLGLGLLAFTAFMTFKALRFEPGSLAMAIGVVAVAVIGLVATLSGLAVVLTAVIARWPTSASRWDEVLLPALVAIGMLASNVIGAVVLGLIAFPNLPFLLAAAG